MITIQRYNPTPRDIWYGLYRQARIWRDVEETTRLVPIKSYFRCIEAKYNIDSDYLMETMGRYALSIT